MATRSLYTLTMKRALTMIFCLVAICMAEENPPISCALGPATPIDSLPAAVKAPDGKLTLYADYNDKRPDGVVLYLVNRTKEAVELDSQDNDIYVKLERKNANGQWERAQMHIYSWCGNSYTMAPLIKPGEYATFLGYEPEEGEPSEVRFRRYAKTHPLVSNVGQLRVSEKDVKNAATDRMAIMFGKLEFVKSVASGAVTLSNKQDEFADLREVAILHLADSEFDSKDVMPLLKSLSTQDDSGHSGYAKYAIEKIQKREAKK